MKNPALLLASLALSACTTTADQSAKAMIFAAAEGSAVGLFEAVTAGDLVVEPGRVIADSRCPINARCVWAGEITVLTKVFYEDRVPDQIETTLGQPVRLHGYVLQLTSAEPGLMAGAEPPQSRDYRFTCESWSEANVPE